jgi:hypothetical protein
LRIADCGLRIGDWGLGIIGRATFRLGGEWGFAIQTM